MAVINASAALRLGYCIPVHECDSPQDKSRSKKKQNYTPTCGSRTIGFPIPLAGETCSTLHAIDGGVLQ